MGFLRKLPLEFYVLLLPAVLVCGSLYFSNNITLQNIDENSILLGSQLGRTIAFLFLVLIATRIFLYTVVISQAPDRDQNKRKKLDDLFSGLLSAIFLFTSIILASGAVGTSALYLFKVSPIDKIITSSTKMMAMDYKIFGSYVPFILQGLGNKMHIIEVTSIWSYTNLLTIIPIFGIISIFKKDVFRKFVLSFFIAVAISWPIWYFMPALQPGLMFKKNILNITVPTYIQQTIESHPSTHYDNLYIEEYDKFWTDPEGKTFSTSNNPSMHVAWGMFLVYYSIEFLPYLGIVTIPWYVFNIIGAMYTLQHYATDVIGGLIIG
ncbi:MAG: phosphatase PAP2 family protein, partial [Candidatus Vogelbacteria bacterium]|nr:phosphatase PAP2 family protein [Candidatus Vogelbacteria bacterium]